MLTFILTVNIFFKKSLRECTHTNQPSISSFNKYFSPAIYIYLFRSHFLCSKKKNWYFYKTIKKIIQNMIIFITLELVINGLKF